VEKESSDIKKTERINRKKWLRFPKISGSTQKCPTKNVLTY
jgi:hypothetical protein